MTDPQTSTFGTGAADPAITTIRRGLEAAPVLRDGLGLTFALAAVGSAGRIVVPILIQQAIDKGIAGRDEVRVGLVVQLALIAVVAVCVAALALRTAQVRRAGAPRLAVKADQPHQPSQPR